MTEVHEITIEDILRSALKEVCSHLSVRLEMEQVFDEKDDVEARKSVRLARQLLEVRYAGLDKASSLSIA